VLDIQRKKGKEKEEMTRDDGRLGPSKQIEKNKDVT
jgi:hypothetical protein